MTRATNARLAGLTYVLYIAVALPETVLFARTTNAQSTAATLALIGRHASEVRLAVFLSLLTCFAAIVLAVALYGITRDEDRDLAVLALTCRIGEGILNAMLTLVTLGLLWLATAQAGAVDAGAATALGGLLLKARIWDTTIGATLFAVGSTLFSYLLLRGRMIPVPLAGLGVLGSAVLVVGLPLKLVGLLAGPVTDLMWLPVAAFELTLGPWLLIKGVAPARR